MMVPQLARHVAVGLLVTLVMTMWRNTAAVGSTHKKFIIHVPLKMKSHHHTHTVYTHIHHGGGKVEYKVLGFSHQGLGGHGDGGVHRGLETAHGGGDLIFNHYARNGEDDVADEFLSDYDEWEP